MFALLVALLFLQPGVSLYACNPGQANTIPSNCEVIHVRTLAKFPSWSKANQYETQLIHTKGDIH